MFKVIEPFLKNVTLFFHRMNTLIPLVISVLDGIIGSGQGNVLKYENVS